MAEKLKKPCHCCGGKGYTEYYDATGKTCGQCTQYQHCRDSLMGIEKMFRGDPASDRCFVPIEEEG